MLQERGIQCMRRSDEKVRPVPPGRAPPRGADWRTFIRQISARRQRTTQLLEDNRHDTSFHLYVSSANVYGFVPAAWSRLPALPVRQRMTLKLAASQTTRPNVLTRMWRSCRLYPWQASQYRRIMATRREQHKAMPDRVMKAQALPDMKERAD
jgi:hypothetical protein